MYLIYSELLEPDLLFGVEDAVPIMHLASEDDQKNTFPNCLWGKYMETWTEEAMAM